MISSGFFVICVLHSAIALTCGALMIFYSKEISVFGHGPEAASKLQGSTPHDQLLIRTSDSFSGLLLFTIGFFLFMVSFVKDREFQSLFAKGCVLLHISMAVWRFYFERKLEDLAHDWPSRLLATLHGRFHGSSFLRLSEREIGLIVPKIGASGRARQEVSSAGRTTIFKIWNFFWEFKKGSIDLH